MAQGADIREDIGYAFDHGSKGSIGATALQLVAAGFKALRGVRVKAAWSNTARVFVGNSDVTAGVAAPTTDGYALSAGEELYLAIDDPSKIYVISDSTGQAVTWLAE